MTPKMRIKVQVCPISIAKEEDPSVFKDSQPAEA